VRRLKELELQRDSVALQLSDVNRMIVATLGAIEGAAHVNDEDLPEDRTQRG
jgi:hypothetical protein